jgi:hypothetical protein
MTRMHRLECRLEEPAITSRTEQCTMTLPLGQPRSDRGQLRGRCREAMRKRLLVDEGVRHEFAKTERSKQAARDP